MTDETPETEPTENDFAAFEAAANAEPDGEQRGEDDEAPAEGDEPLELTEEAKPEGEDDGEPKGDDKKTRSHRWQTRVDALTARLREAEQRALVAESKAGIETKDDGADQPPNPDQYEWGEGDPAYIKALARHEAKAIVAEERHLARQQEARQAVATKLELGMATIEQAGAEKYEDFEAKVTAAVEARGGEPLPPLLSVGLAVSPAGADITYRLATDGAIADELEQLAGVDPEAAAERFGELEGEYLSDDKDLNLKDPLDRARWRGRRFARRMGTKAPEKAPVKATAAPEPPGHRVRGGGGQFETSPDTTDFAKFEKMAKKAAAG